MNLNIKHWYQILFLKILRYRCNMLILMVIIEYLYVLLYFTLQIILGCCRSFNQFVSGITLCLQHKGLRISRLFTHQRTLSSMLHSLINLQLIWVHNLYLIFVNLINIMCSLAKILIKLYFLVFFPFWIWIYMRIRIGSITNDLHEKR